MLFLQRRPRQSPERSCLPTKPTRAFPASSSSSWHCIGRKHSTEELSVPRATENFALVEYQPAAEDRLQRPAGDFEAFPRRVVRPVMEDFLPDGLLSLWIPNHQIGVGADCDRSFLWIKPIHLRVIRRRERDELFKRNTPLDYALGEQDGETRFHAGYSIWNPAEGRARLRIQFSGRAFVEVRAMMKKS